MVMKKALLVLVLVLGLVSSSQAGLIGFQLANGSLVAAGQTVTINLISDQACNGWFIDGVAEVDAAGNQTYLGGLVSNLQVNPSALSWGFNFINNYHGALFSSIGGVFFGTLPAGETILSFDYMINSMWDGSAIIIAPLEAGKIYTCAEDFSYEVFSSMANIGIEGDAPIQALVIPEPMTIGLFGLGGLLLRRKK
jgi:hypothetical protein